MKTILFTLTLWGCVGQTATPAAAESAYLAEQLACIDKAKTLEESRTCRDGVKARWAAVDGGSDGR